MALRTPKVALVLNAGKGTQGDAKSQVRPEVCARGVTGQRCSAPWQGFSALMSSHPPPCWGPVVTG